jgi:hypothetical protein
LPDGRTEIITFASNYYDKIDDKEISHKNILSDNDPDRILPYDGSAEKMKPAL